MSDEFKPGEIAVLLVDGRAGRRGDEAVIVGPVVLMESEAERWYYEIETAITAPHGKMGGWLIRPQDLGRRPDGDRHPNSWSRWGRCVWKPSGVSA